MLSDNIDSVCIAYRSSNGCFESFKDHVSEIIECLENRWETRGLKRKLSKPLNVQEMLIECHLILAALLHDIGKTLESNQKTCRQSECKSFPCHYVVSSLFAIRLVEDLFKNVNISDYLKRILTEPDHRNIIGTSGNVDEVEKYLFLTLTFLPVLLHHYAGITEESIDECKKRVPKSIKIDNVCIDVILSLVDKMENRCSLDSFNMVLKRLKSLLRNNEQIPLGVSPINYNSLYNTVTSFTKGIVEAAMGLLNICDGKVANTNRQCKETR